MLFNAILGFILILGSYSAHALTISDDRGTVEIELPKDWKYEKNLMGLPHVLLGPEGSHRASFSMTLTGLSEMKLPGKELAKNQSQYQDGRKKWAGPRGFYITKFIPYQNLQTDPKNPTHSIGFQYKDQKQEYLEMSYFTECPHSLVHSKALGIVGSDQMKIAQKIIQSLRCQK